MSYDRKTLHRAMRHDVLLRFPGFDGYTDDEIGAVYAAIPAHDAGDEGAISRAVDYQRSCARYLASMERAVKAEQDRLAVEVERMGVMFG